MESQPAWILPCSLGHSSVAIYHNRHSGSEKYMSLYFVEKTSNLERCANPIIPGEREISTFHLTHLDNMINLCRLPLDKLFIWFITVFEVFPTTKGNKLFSLKIWAKVDDISMLFRVLREDMKILKPMDVFILGL